MHLFPPDMQHCRSAHICHALTMAVLHICSCLHLPFQEHEAHAAVRIEEDLSNICYRHVVTGTTATTIVAIDPKHVAIIPVHIPILDLGVTERHMHRCYNCS
jgi:hypothetical protein